MLSAKDVRSVTFSKQMNGYRREEVDVFLDKVEADYENYERIIKEMSAKVHELETQIADTKNSEGSIQSVLLSAQKLADSIIAEAKEKSGKIVEEAKHSLNGFKAREQELSDAFERKAQARKQIAQAELDKIIDEAKENKDRISEATENTVKKQVELYNRLRLETAAFKAEIMDKYKRQLELISKIPDTIPTNPEEIAAAVNLNVSDLSDKDAFIKELEGKTYVPPKQDDDDIDADAIISEIVRSMPEERPEPAPQEEKQSGFVVNTGIDGNTDE